VVLDAGRRMGAATVIDVPRHPGPVADRVLEQADLIVLVTPADVRGCWAADRVCARIREFGTSAGVVVRGRSPGGGSDVHPGKRCGALLGRSDERSRLANDDDGDHDKLRAVLREGPRHGHLDLEKNGSFCYRPHEGFHGEDRFRYYAVDRSSRKDDATVTIHVEKHRD